MLYFILLPLLLILVYKLLFCKTRRFNHPPRPPSRPIVGYPHLMKPPVHRLLQCISDKYGKIFFLRYGSTRVLQLTAKYVGYTHTTVRTALYGDHWGNLCRICSLEILSSNRLTSFLYIRKDEICLVLGCYKIRQMLTRLSCAAHSDEDGSHFTNVALEPLLSELTFNNIVRMVSGKRYYGDDVGNKEEVEQFKKLVHDISMYSSANDSRDYFPVLKLFGNKFEKEVMATDKSMDDDVTIKGLLMAMMLVGTETSAITLEWAMISLLKHPRVMEKARLEIDEKIREDHLIDEPDLSDLPYLQNVVSETFHLFPVAPLHVSRTPTKDMKIGGKEVDTMESSGLGMHKMDPLRAMHRPRPIMAKLIIRG
ncbi:hypothetical protein N665_0547s0004 [Sinapis alba]|nr:hypothetical protein N665_0547s0004 [Sinapis alba]